ncbi:MAG: MoxR family ATPase [Nanoarchaeota archaeon]|nr:MoxR family ATPase [Nanoarchaeota archaeon]
MAEEEIVSDKRASSFRVKEISKTLFQMRKEVSKVIFGQQASIDSLIRGLLCNGHILLEGVPGIAKTLLIKTMAQVSGCSFKRIQFTADMLPADILGFMTYDPKNGFQISKGPIFSNFIIADEINRSPPKTQSAMIEAMQEKQVTIGKTTFQLPAPFFVMANQNPIENEGVYSLPEAQVDRFLFKIIIDYPDMESEERIMSENTTLKKFEDYNIRPITTPNKITAMQKTTNEIYLDPKIKQYILKIVKKTRDKDFDTGQYIDLGCSPRASISLYIAAKSEALLQGRNYVIPADVRVIAEDVMRHRLILSYRARADGITSEKIISDIFKSLQSGK